MGPVTPFSVTDDIDPDILSNYKVSDEPPNNNENRMRYVYLWAYQILIITYRFPFIIRLTQVFEYEEREQSFDAEEFASLCEVRYQI